MPLRKGALQVSGPSPRRSPRSGLGGAGVPSRGQARQALEWPVAEPEGSGTRQAGRPLLLLCEGEQVDSELSLGKGAVAAVLGWGLRLC